ncbi:hypothetical protein EV421DRAFT_1739514 [Armillaria borealis]|uniref:PEBP-like protein n=1 Tax=Armillaria borealis TaxID=47425 RepID=A0AA39MK16_9AGAR|nr:hypothetical protein EV421DRAFT_1739514 [Armillaria borealis]
MLSISSFYAISLLAVSSPSLAVYRGLFSQTCYPSISHGAPRVGAQGVCINNGATIRMGGKPQILTRRIKRMQDGGCSAGRNRQTPCKNFNTKKFNTDEYPYGTTRCIYSSQNKARQVETPPFFDAYLREKTRFFENSGTDPGYTFGIGFVWGQQVLNPPIPAAVMQMCYGQRFTSVFRRETSELREVTAERKSAVVEPIWLRTARNLTVMAYGDIKLRTPVWSGLHDGEDEVVRIIDPSDPDYPPKLSTKTTGSESGGGQSTKATGGKSTKTTGATPTGPIQAAVMNVIDVDDVISLFPLTAAAAGPRHRYCLYLTVIKNEKSWVPPGLLLSLVGRRRDRYSGPCFGCVAQ